MSFFKVAEVHVKKSNKQAPGCKLFMSEWKEDSISKELEDSLLGNASHTSAASFSELQHSATSFTSSDPLQVISGKTGINVGKDINPRKVFIYIYHYG